MDGAVFKKLFNLEGYINLGRQDFTANGNLNPGIHSYTITEFEEQFIKEFPNSSRRKLIYNDFRMWIKNVINEVPPRYIWLDGSFLTEKLNPNDLDLVLFYRPEDIPSKDISNKLGFLINNVSRKFNCDAYFTLTLDHLDPMILQQMQQTNPQSTMMKTYWKGQFGFDRKNQAKGIILIEEAEIKNLGGDFQCV